MASLWEGFPRADSSAGLFFAGLRLLCSVADSF
jgi:hypothetical protein